MAAQVDIRTLFARLRLEHFQGYLSNTGWRSVSEGDGYHWFEFDDGDEHPCRVRLPVSNQSPYRVKLLQQAVYCLCDVEDRQPAEIANDLLATPFEPPESAEVETTRLRFRNSQASPITVSLASRETGVELMPGEAIELVCQHASDANLEIDVQESAIVVKDEGKH